MLGLSGGVNVSFVVVGIGLVIAFVRYVDRQQTKTAALNEHITIQIKMEVDDSSEEEGFLGETLKEMVTAKERLTSGCLGIKSELSVLVERPRVDVFTFASKYGENIIFRPALVTINENERFAKLKISAVHTLCQEIDNPHCQSHLMVSGEDTRADLKNFIVDDVGCSPLRHRGCNQQAQESR